MSSFCQTSDAFATSDEDSFWSFVRSRVKYLLNNGRVFLNPPMLFVRKRLYLYEFMENNDSELGEE
jgi:hypothetical protein